MKIVHVGDYMTIRLRGWKWDRLSGSIVSSNLTGKNRWIQAVECLDCDGYNAFEISMNAIESLILAHACARVDVADEMYVAGIKTAIDALTNNL